ncbi:hypothetical protein OEZ85_010113 [Tetradesmus obliquus]|uniref:Uncharacterized protein n=1 Tax=Tetradesmus obliquus TaxID=3088 RepID=A0ABY8TL99_TETOB|nr:hypothetical protein OEZ85_010113 [Tetradesmus obliquus]
MMIEQDSEDQAVQRRRPFNVSSKRFSTPAACVNVCPGPGVYTGDAATAWQYGSLGRKGFGAMCSSSKRLAVRLQYTGPGPDQHRQRRQHSKAAAAVPTSSRVGLTSAQLAHRISAAVLGGRSTSAPPRSSRCTFDAAARAAAEVPAVGSYDVVSVGAISSSLQRRLAENRCSPMFAQPLLPSSWPQRLGPAFYRPGLLPVKTSHRRATSPEAAAAFLAAV